MARGGLLRARIGAVVTLVALALTLPGTPAAACTRVGSVTIGQCRTDQRPKATSTPSPETQLLRMLNQEREARGLRRLRSDPRARAVAEEHARRMARRGRIYHNPALGTPAGRERLGNPRYVGENVGVGPSTRSIHGAFMRSRKHRANIIHRRFRSVGIGAVWSGGSLWVVEVFLSREAAPADARGKAAPARATRTRIPARALDHTEGTDIRGMAVGIPTLRSDMMLDDWAMRSSPIRSSTNSSGMAALLGLLSLGTGILLRRRPQVARSRA